MLKNIGSIALRIVLVFIAVSLFSVIAFRWIPIPVTPLMLLRCGQQWLHHEPLCLYKSWRTIENISPSLPLAVVAAEDQNYLDHFGFDTKAIQEAVKYNEHHKKKRGASTISQQTAKNVFLYPSRSYLRKGLEVYFTFLIEVFWSKERIMEVYLNVIEMGKGVYGAEAAAQTYYNKSAKNLNAAQCAAIASILPNPINYKLVRPSMHVLQRQQWILRQMQNIGGALEWEKSAKK